jgi:cyanuric acid amidohydrolase
VFESFVHTIAMQGPADMSGLVDLFDEHGVDPAQIVGVIAQTEGDGHARGYCALCLSLLLAERLDCAVAEISARIPLLMIGGTAGLMSPHMTVFCRRPVSADGARAIPDRTSRALAVGTAMSAPLRESELGRIAQVEAACDAVRAAMHDAGIDDPDDVACVEIKCPNGDGSDPATGPRSRGASALGAAIALGEIRRDQVDDAAILADQTLFTSRASASSGTELTDIRVIVVGNRSGIPGDLVAGCGVMRDALDLGGAHDAFRNAGLRLVDGIVPAEDRHRVASVFVNAGADYVPTCRGRRHTMRSDALTQYSGHLAKAVAHAQVAGIAGTPLVLGNAGAEHQGPPGGNLVCVIARKSSGAGA